MAQRVIVLYVKRDACHNIPCLSTFCHLCVFFVSNKPSETWSATNERRVLHKLSARLYIPTPTTASHVRPPIIPNDSRHGPRGAHRARREPLRITRAFTRCHRRRNSHRLPARVRSKFTPIAYVSRSVVHRPLFSHRTLQNRHEGAGQDMFRACPGMADAAPKFLALTVAVARPVETACVGRSVSSVRREEGAFRRIR